MVPAPIRLEGEGVLSLCMAVARPSHTEHVGFSPTRQTLLAPTAKRREVLGESHEG